MIIKRWTKLSGTAKYLPTAANFPCLKHYFPMSEDDNGGAGVDSLGDVVGGLSLSISGGAGNNTTYPQCKDLTNASALAAGTIASPGTKSIVLCCVGVPASTVNNVTVGSVTANTNQGIRVSAVSGSAKSSMCLNATSAMLCTDGAVGAGTRLAYAAQGTIVPSGTTLFDAVDYDGTTFTARTEKSTAGTPAGGMVAIEQAFVINSGVSPGAIFILHPTTAFTAAELKAIVAWAYWAVFTANAGAGDKNSVIAPWLRGHV